MVYEHIIPERSTFSRQDKRGLERVEDTYATIPGIVHWWDQYAKRMVKNLFTRESMETSTE